MEGVSEQSFVDRITAPLGLFGVLGVSVIQSDLAQKQHLGLGQVVVHEALHLLGLEVIGRKYLHTEGPFKSLGCSVMHCSP